MFKWIKVGGAILLMTVVCAIAGGSIGKATGEVIQNILESDS